MIRSVAFMIRGTGEGELRADAYVALRVLSGLRYPSELIDRILRRREIMLESPVYREILEEGKALGENVLEVLEVRFGIVPSSLEELVRKVQGKRALEGLHRRAILMEDVETFREDVRRLLET